MIIDIFTKHPGEAYTKAIDYTDRLPTGATPQSVSVTAASMLDGSDAASILGAAAVSGNTVRVPVTGGTDGRSYLITVATTLTNGNVFVDQLEMQVRGN